MNVISPIRHNPMSKKHKTSKPVSSPSSSNRSHKTHQQNRIWLWMGLGLATVLILVVAFLLWPKTTQPTEISVSQAYQKYQQGAFFLDVRSQAEWDQMHIARSTLIPLDVLQNHLNELPRDRDLVGVCRSGVRSKEGMTILQQAGFLRASCMTGGLIAWQAAGYPLEISSP